jgi:hypothetical protein
VDEYNYKWRPCPNVMPGSAIDKFAESAAPPVDGVTGRFRTRLKTILDITSMLRFPEAPRK